ncbi:MAG: alpha/beta hydrolase [Rhodospirillaceae bacterium]|nr:alpha/beta hydrolase [Rhodospirillaceae bacterium]|tara:strand:+ start:777 stop:1745 length:969 start_codon:yes stop_codon:yes gene_type:complete
MSKFSPPKGVTKQTAEFLKKLASMKLPPVVKLTPKEAREQMERGVAARETVILPIGETRELRIPGPAGLIPARLYIPRVSGSRPPGLLVYYHGGGHVIGSLFSHDASARGLCYHGRCAVLSIDYRMAPEDVFPASVDDSYAALVWASENAKKLGCDPKKIAVGGDSAGGNLAAVVALMSRDKTGPKVCYQVLIYPLVDYRCEGESYKKFGKGYGILEAETMRWFQNHYLGRDPKRHRDWRASPLLAKSHAGLPPAIIIAAGCDVLRDEARNYATSLIKAGVSVEFIEYPGVLHGFFGLTQLIDEADTANLAAGRAIVNAMTD